MTKTSALVIFGDDLPHQREKWWQQFDTVVASRKFEQQIKKYHLAFVALEELVDPGSVQEASNWTADLSRLELADGSRLTGSSAYRGYELWWIHYQKFFIYYGLPYTQYQRLLKYLINFQCVNFYRPAYFGLFSSYLKAYQRESKVLGEWNFLRPAALPFGILLQILITLFSVPILIWHRRHLLVFIGDKFEKSKDYDFRMKFVYQELRQRNIPFVEFVRSLESWRTVLQHALIRRRPVIYSEAITFIGRFCSLVTGGRWRARRKFSTRLLANDADPEKRFQLLVATQPLFTMADDIWTIRIMKRLLGIIDIRAALLTAATERSLYTVLGCKLRAIPTVGIMHSASSKNYNVYDFMPNFTGAKNLSVDKYGVWSEWWKEYYLKNGRAYGAEQLFVSGPMRPLEMGNKKSTDTINHGLAKIKVLFISEQLAVPAEVMPYLEALLKNSDLDLTIKFRPFRDGFEQWLMANRPDLLRADKLRVLRGNVEEAVRESDVVVGSNSTVVLEALLQLKVSIFFHTKKWGDYFSIRESQDDNHFFANNPEELIEKIKLARVVQPNALKNLQERYLGDPERNGSKWVIDQLDSFLSQ